MNGGAMTWYITIRSDPSYSRTVDPRSVASFLASVPELVQTGINTFSNAAGNPWVRLVLAMSKDGSYADHGQPHAAINLIDVLCGGQHDPGWYDSLARRIAAFLDWEAVDEVSGRTLWSAGAAG